MWGKSMQSRNKRGYVLTMEAGICFLVLVFFINYISLGQQDNSDLNEEILFQQAQDIFEVCAVLNELNENCFRSIVSKANFDYCFNNCENAMVKRNGIEFSLLLK